MLTKNNLMIKKALIAVIAIFSLLTISACGNEFGMQWYQQSKNLDIGSGQQEDIRDEPIDIPNAANDPFLKPENNDPNANGFSADVFDTWLLEVRFDNKNVPVYKFNTNPNKTWQSSGSTDDRVEEFFYHGANSTAGNNSITSMKYFLYKHLNPFYPLSNFYNKTPHAGRLDRFYFYRHTGKGGGVANLNNYLIAVDSYTKLVFAYAVPTKTTSILGNEMPIAWGPVDVYTSVDGSNFKFYEFDPVGIVAADGSVEVFPWFQTARGAGGNDPILGDPTRDIATYHKEGRSPYITTQSAAGQTYSPVSGNLKAKLASVENVDFYDGGSAKAQFEYKFSSSYSNGNAKNKRIDILAQHDAGGKLIYAKNLDVGQSIHFDTVFSYDVASNKNIYLDLDTDLTELDFGMKKDKIAEASKPTLSLIFDRASSAWVINKDLPMEFIDGTRVEFDRTFSVNKGDINKTLEVVFKHAGAASDGKGEGSIRLTYEFSWSEIEKPLLAAELVSLENISFMDAWGDAWLDGTDMPEFLYKFKISFDDRVNLHENVLLESTNNYTKTPAYHEHINKGKTKPISKTKNYVLDSIKSNMSFKLVNDLFESDIGSFTKLLEIDNTNIEFVYAQATNSWKLQPIQAMPNTTLTYDAGFELKDGDFAKPFEITITHDKDGAVKLLYRLSWEDNQ